MFLYAQMVVIYITFICICHDQFVVVSLSWSVCPSWSVWLSWSAHHDQFVMVSLPVMVILLVMVSLLVKVCPPWSSVISPSWSLCHGQSAHHGQYACHGLSACHGQPACHGPPIMVVCHDKSLSVYMLWLVCHSKSESASGWSINLAHLFFHSYCYTGSWRIDYLHVTAGYYCCLHFGVWSSHF